MSKALELISTLIDGANEYEKKTGNTNPTVYLSRNNLLVIEKALLKAQEPKKYLKWEDLEFSYGTKTQKVRMVDTIYKIVYANYDNTKEVQLLSEDEKCYYIGFTGNYKDNVQLFNDLHLERAEE